MCGEIIVGAITGAKTDAKDSCVNGLLMLTLVEHKEAEHAECRID
jgi:hypothetical protein